MLTRVLRSANFKLALLYAAVFSVSVLVLVTVIFLSVREDIEMQARTHIESEIAQLMGDYADDGMDELRHDIRERIDTGGSRRLRYSIVAPDGKSIFDALDAPAGRKGWHRKLSLSGDDLLIDSVPLEDGYTLLVAADLSIIHDIEDAIRGQLFALLLFIAAAAAMGGLVLSRRFLARIDRISRTTEQVGAGNLSARLPMAGTGDDFDQLSATINRMLERIEQLVGEVQHVANGIAHDLRTPLGHLRQTLEQIRSEAENPRQQAKMDEALEQLDGALATFSALLRIAEIESGSRKAGFARFDLSALMQQMVELYQPVAEEAGITLSAALKPNLCIEGDAALMRQYFSNLIENALRHSGGTQLQLGLKAEGSQIIAEVRDNGVGIAQTDHVVLVQPFFRADASRSTPGNGLGLPLAKAISRLHEAELHFADAGPGLVVQLVFPRISAKNAGA